MAAVLGGLFGGMMLGSLFGGKKSETPQVVQPDNAAADRLAAEELANTMRKRKGRVATIGTSPIGLSGLNSTTDVLGG